ncbi:MAG TPA: hypothetical protein VFW96_25475, partial [Thermomicrobiales bacterium]|nr:hypothetical protein [Thermomicrobiales bacterium]
VGDLHALAAEEAVARARRALAPGDRTQRLADVRAGAAAPPTGHYALLAEAADEWRALAAALRARRAAFGADVRERLDALGAAEGGAHD